MFNVASYSIPSLASSSSVLGVCATAEEGPANDALSSEMAFDDLRVGLKSIENSDSSKSNRLLLVGGGPLRYNHHTSSLYRGT